MGLRICDLDCIDCLFDSLVFDNEQKAKQQKEETNVPVVNFKTQLGLVDEGTYPVILKDVVEKKTKNGDDMIMFSATIHDSDTQFDGRVLNRNFVFKADSENNNQGVVFHLQNTLLAFGADEDDVTEDGIDPVVFAKANLLGNKAEAKVTHNPDRNDPTGAKKFMSVDFALEGLD